MMTFRTLSSWHQWSTCQADDRDWSSMGLPPRASALRYASMPPVWADSEMSLMRTFEDVGSQLPPIRLDVLPVDGDREEIVNYLRSYPGLDQRRVQQLR